ncbi:DegT/DnrJ/EryC1/StrS family aminotransferase [Streptomyces sp. CBMA156]|uniref:DegT/DnrJ/EryC1/StrS family aminotransferase n=1 Tax=Streptomyces sp. CBMA156 TaxID=1930280 RepID=UPI001661A8A1|nr:aminotransferase class V-fold PLP-dependent enzyme [Streptomyces sp. CBMA156]MBD0673123.1 L-alanine--N-amidino-3-keto-scyllo-inosamine aminotransferase [Streptomyces sp. CBMA156]
MPGPGYSYFGAEERRNLLEVVDSWLATSDAHSRPPGVDAQVRGLEQELSARFDSPYCLGVNSGTSALLAALAALGIGPGDEVIVPGYMYAASVSAVVFAGATPVIAEIDESLTLDPADVRARITPRTRAVMPVHMLGAPCDLSALGQLADDHGLFLLEDAAQACGATYRGRPVGTFGQAGAFSTNIFKVITGGDGGFLLTQDERTFQRAYSFHHHGWYPYGQESADGDQLFGLNLRMNEFTAAVVRAQLGRLDAILEHNRSLARALAAAIPAHDGLRPRLLHDADGDCATLLVYVFEDAASADAVAKELGTRPLLQSPKHYYGGLPELTALMAGDARPSPFRRPPENVRHDYRAGALPQTDSVLARSVALTIGLTDTYLAADFGLTARSTLADVEAVAERFDTAVSEVLGR